MAGIASLNMFAALFKYVCCFIRLVLIQ